MYSASFSVLMNGIPGEYIKRKRGIRQEDPIQPYVFFFFLFVLIILVDILIFTSNIPKSGTSIRTSKRGPSTCKPNRKAAIVKAILHDYCNVSG